MEKMHRLAPVTKEPPTMSGPVSGGETQAQIEIKMEGIAKEYQSLFEGIGKAKIKPIHIFTKRGRKPVAQRQRPVALNYMEPLKKHLDELLSNDVIEGPLGSEHATGWISNIVITGKGWDPNAIRVNLDTMLMTENVLATHFPIPTPDQLRVSSDTVTAFRSWT